MLSEESKRRLTRAVDLGRQTGVVGHLQEAGPRQLVAWLIEDFAHEPIASDVSANFEEAERMVAGLIGIC